MAIKEHDPSPKISLKLVELLIVVSVISMITSGILK